MSTVVLTTHGMTAAGLGPIDLAALAVIVLVSVRQWFLVQERGRLLIDTRGAHHELEIALNQRAEADSRYRTLVEHVPAAVYIDVSDPAVSDGGHLAYLSPQIEAILGYPPEILRRRPGAVADPDPSRGSRPGRDRPR